MAGVLVVKQGADQVLEIPDVKVGTAPLDPSGCSVRGQIRQRAASTTVLHSWSSVGLGANASLSTGLVSLQLIGSVTAAWTWRRAEFDVELIDALGHVSRIAQGVIYVSPEVTKN